MARKNSNPHNLVLGSKVTLPARADGVEHRDGNEAVWEIISLHRATGTATVRLVGAGPDRTAGAHLGSLVPAN